ncbi:hypothetical protein BCR32DRAFT_298206 [Anaeromyces robustus]|uniref:AH domain-containing protein n=1 Tax=Anaeromyces robustus TaxID=1754192 RepID=A0A1Y1VS75_9FUNG|nr:hypothetical protein BCR32DRAFT_298206 [Anaeromyces robustus]|eukprot:ORX64117.1 hypothetical protein BCR32DRAFT_298206 [Anaeromyces robustus]
MTNQKERRNSYNKFSFKMSIFGQSFMESVQNTFTNTLSGTYIGDSLGIKKSRCVAPIVDGQVDEATKKVESLKKFIEGSQKSMKTIIDNLTKTIEAEQTLSILYSEESAKEEKDVDLRYRYSKSGDAFNRDNKELSKYLVPLKNYEEWLSTFLNKAIRDTEDTIYNCNQARIEIQTYSSYLNDAKERLKTEVEGSMEHLSDQKIVEESEYHLEQSKARFAKLKIQLKEKADMLELKRQIDIPNYLDSVHNAIRLYHQAAFAIYALPNPKDTEVESIHTTNDSITSDENVSLHSLPSSLPSSHLKIASSNSFEPR